MKAWIYQRESQVTKFGADAASWYVGWRDPAGKRHGKSCGAGKAGKKKAEILAKQIDSELTLGTYQDRSKKPWAEFKTAYLDFIGSRLDVRSVDSITISLDHFEAIINPQTVNAIDVQIIDEFTAKRLKARGKKGGSSISIATVNRDLRNIRAALRKAAEWKFITNAPKVKLLKEPKKLPRFVTTEHFQAIYAAADSARYPRVGWGGLSLVGDDGERLAVDPADWWRGLLVFAFMTGWRISEILALKRSDIVDGRAITRHQDNKGGRDEQIKLAPIVLDHLAKLPDVADTVFPWPHDRKHLDVEFRRIQEAAGIRLECRDDHKHTPACHVYGFHDCRRAFATNNAAKLSGPALQSLMRHKSYATTLRYINMANQLDEAVDSLFVPNVGKTRKGG